MQASSPSSPASRRARPAICISAMPLPRCSPSRRRGARSGRFLLRIEDIDRTPLPAGVRGGRSSRILAWLGLDWEKPVRRQSEHLADYRAGARPAGSAGACSIPASAPARRSRPRSPPPRARRRGRRAALSRHLPAARSEDIRAQRIGGGRALCAAPRRRRAAARGRGAARLGGSERGLSRSSPGLLGDVVLARKDIAASYHLAVTVDDALQGVTLVTRGRGSSAGHPRPSPAPGAARIGRAALATTISCCSTTTGERLAKRDGAMTLAARRAAAAAPGTSGPWRDSRIPPPLQALRKFEPARRRGLPISPRLPTWEITWVVGAESR